MVQYKHHRTVWSICKLSKYCHSKCIDTLRRRSLDEMKMLYVETIAQFLSLLVRGVHMSSSLSVCLCFFDRHRGCCSISFFFGLTMHQLPVHLNAFRCTRNVFPSICTSHHIILLFSKSSSLSIYHSYSSIMSLRRHSIFCICCGLTTIKLH